MYTSQLDGVAARQSAARTRQREPAADQPVAKRRKGDKKEGEISFANTQNEKSNWEFATRLQAEDYPTPWCARRERKLPATGGAPVAAVRTSATVESPCRGDTARSLSTISNVSKYCGVTVGSRLEYWFSALEEHFAGGWVGGTVVKLLHKWRGVHGWVRVRFDDGDVLDVLLKLSGEGESWRRELAVSTGSSTTDGVLAYPMSQQAKMEVCRVGTANRQQTTKFFGVTKQQGKWKASIRHGGKEKYIGRFGDEEAAAHAFDAAARRLRGAQAHGGRANARGSKSWRLNFPTAAELSSLSKVTQERSEARQSRSSRFIGVKCDRHGGKWIARIVHKRKEHNLGTFETEETAAHAFDAASRRLRGVKAHGGRGKQGYTWLLNFPTASEQAAFERVKQERSEALQPRASSFVGVKQRANGKWQASLTHQGKKHNLGTFAAEHEEAAARAVDEAARGLRGDKAHGGRGRGMKHGYKLNFPTAAEVALAATARKLRPPVSRFAGVSWHAASGKWSVRLKTAGKVHSLGYFHDEEAAARAFDVAARRLRGDEAHGGFKSRRATWLLNFPTASEQAAFEQVRGLQQ
eukprot:COSAG02_NODE_4674_length_5106_cov_9.921310_2_plen_580_part_00